MHRKVSSMRDGTLAEDEEEMEMQPSVPSSVLSAISDAVNTSRTVCEMSDQPKVDDVVLSTPFLLKPLLTVYASCIPRREAQFGSRFDEQLFLSASPTTSTGAEAAKTSSAAPGPLSTQTQRSRGEDGKSGGADQPWFEKFQPNPLSDEEVYAALQKRGIPTIPRYSTRVTVLIEHNEMEPVDLLLLAEISTTRKGGEDKQNKAYDGVRDTGVGLKLPRIYCLIVDGGEY
ncbi:unnamed protein product [Phytomonas sp. Hart1]|nr:unnamed protein product [Phytomonas sp. Hart1]|eukprot:CCW66599.1 unnamed protein product [Phytomonas sp. isolate Hart1]